MQIASAAVKESRTRKLVIAGLVAALVGALFLLPHLVQITLIGDWESYSPFSAHSNSPMVWDETFLYGAEANYMLTRGGAPAYDDDWEHRLTPYPYSILPVGLEALNGKDSRQPQACASCFQMRFSCNDSVSADADSLSMRSR